MTDFDARRLGREILRGVGRGAVATVAMSVPMLLAGRKHMGAQPPKRITVGLFRRLGIRERNERQRNLATTLAHLGFGTAFGALFTTARAALRAPGPALPQGLAYGVGVWAVSYKGWIPALGLLPPPERDRPDRQWTMFFAHLVYGAVLGLERR